MLRSSRSTKQLPFKQLAWTEYLPNFMCAPDIFVKKILELFNRILYSKDVPVAAITKKRELPERQRLTLEKYILL